MYRVITTADVQYEQHFNCRACYAKPELLHSKYLPGLAGVVKAKRNCLRQHFV